MAFLCAGKSEAERVEKHLQRIADGILPEDRQDAVAELRDLLSHNAEVCTHAIAA
jgi:hypothetical protein